jgi:hypothetical protein
MISKKAKKMSGAAHIAHSEAKGTEGERKFYDSCMAKKLNVKKTPKKDDINHIDFIVDGKTYDVKGLKASHNHGLIVLEKINVQGKQGWCNPDGVPEWVAFDFGILFLCVKNLDLYNLMEECCDLEDLAPNAMKCYHRGWTRKGRKDLITMVGLNEVFVSCEHWILPIQKYHQKMEQASREEVDELL